MDAIDIELPRTVVETVNEHLEIKEKLAVTAGEALTECLRLQKSNTELKTTISEMNAVRTNMIRDYDVMKAKLERCRKLLASIDQHGVYVVGGIAEILEETKP